MFQIINKVFRGNSGYALLVLDRGKSLTSLPCPRTISGIHWSGSWMCPRAGPNVVDKNLRETEHTTV
jgi:hypothetical protein